MNGSTTVIDLINEKFSSMSKGHKAISNYVLKNYDKAAFLTAAKLGEETGVSESTVVRFASSLGFDGYPEFQKSLSELVRNRLNSIQRMEYTYERIDKSEILSSVLTSDAEKIHQTLNEIDREAFDNAVDTIAGASKIYVIGIRSCAPLASFLAFYLNLIYDNVKLVNTSSATEIFEQMVRIGPDDVVIGISFPRYSLRTLKAMEFAGSRSAKLISITDSVNSPMTLYSSCNLIARSDMASIVDSLTAPLSVVNALIVALCMRNQDHVIENLSSLEKIWKEYEVYAADELEKANDKIILQE